MNFDGMQVFSATTVRDRTSLGERVTEWLDRNRDRVEIVDKQVTQSSDAEYHCLTITLMYKHKKK